MANYAIFSLFLLGYGLWESVITSSCGDSVLATEAETTIRETCTLQYRHKLASRSFQKQHRMDKLTLINFHCLNTEELKSIDLLEHHMCFVVFFFFWSGPYIQDRISEPQNPHKWVWHTRNPPHARAIIPASEGWDGIPGLSWLMRLAISISHGSDWESPPH